MDSNRESQHYLDSKPRAAARFNSSNASPPPVPHLPGLQRRKVLKAVQGRQHRWFHVSLTCILLVVASTFSLCLDRPAPSPSEPEGPVAEEEMRAAMAAWLALFRDPNGTRPMGVDRSQSGDDVIPAQFSVTWDPANHSVETGAFVGFGLGGQSYIKRQKGSTMNVVLDGKLYLGRDEDPTTLPPYGGPKTPDGLAETPDGIPAGMKMDRGPEDPVREQPATQFTGSNETHTLKIWVFDDTKQLARINVEGPKRLHLQYDPRWGDQLRVHAETHADHRASFTLEDELDSGSAPGSPGDTRFNGSISDKHVEEVRLSEVELRATTGVGNNRTILASMRLDQGNKTQGNFTFSYFDRDGDGLISAGDDYELVVRHAASQGGASPSFYDLWASLWEGGPIANRY